MEVLQLRLYAQKNSSKANLQQVQSLDFLLQDHLDQVDHWDLVELAYRRRHQDNLYGLEVARQT